MRALWLLLVAGPAWAWEPLSGETLQAALAARVLQFEDATYGFRQDGVATQDDGAWTEGRWRVEGPRLCIAWPEERDDCATVERERIDLRLTRPDGSVRIGRYVDLQ